jgi:short-subunit dehydrogenase
MYQSAIITGASSGIGAAFAEVLPPATNLLLTARRTQQLTEVAGRVSRPRRRVEVVAADLRSRADRERLIRRSQDFGVDLLVCNAGAAVYGPFLGKTLEDELEFLEVNVTAVVHLLHALTPIVLENAQARHSRGAVVLVSSTAAGKASPNMASYAAAKAFQTRLIQSLAAELRNEPIDFLALCPTYTATEFFAKAGIPTGHLARPMLTPRSVAEYAMKTLGVGDTVQELR